MNNIALFHYVTSFLGLEEIAGMGVNFVILKDWTCLKMIENKQILCFDGRAVDKNTITWIHIH